jgi:hypothetical protein
LTIINGVEKKKKNRASKIRLSRRDSGRVGSKSGFFFLVSFTRSRGKSHRLFRLSDTRRRRRAAGGGGKGRRRRLTIPDKERDERRRRRSTARDGLLSR